MANLSQQLQIDTPENVLLDADIAGFGTRCVAAILDYLILSVALIGVAILYQRTYGASIENETVSLGILILFQFALITFYHLFFEFVWNGQTPGKRRLNLRVVQANGLPLTTNGAIIRNLVRLFDFFPVFYGVGLAALFASKQGQRLGDIAAGTLVIKERPQLTVAAVKEDWAVHYQHITSYSPLPDYIDIRPLTETDRRAIVDYLGRRERLFNRAQVAVLLAEQMAERMATTPETDLRLPIRAETFLEQTARAFELREAGEE